MFVWYKTVESEDAGLAVGKLYRCPQNTKCSSSAPGRGRLKNRDPVPADSLPSIAWHPGQDPLAALRTSSPATSDKRDRRYRRTRLSHRH